MSIYEAIRNKQGKLAIVGLGCVGLPLAAQFGKSVKTIGFSMGDPLASLSYI